VQLVLVRHARPERVELAEGPADPSLDESGRLQAGALAKWCASEGFDALYSSPLRRARQTAEPVEATTGLAVRVEEGVAEWDREANTYIPTEQLPEAAPEVWAALVGNDLTALGIDLAGFVDRTISSLDAITAAHRSQSVAVVCHGGVINAYVAHVLGLERVLFFEPGYTSVTRVLVSGNGRRSLVSLNEMPHLSDPEDRRASRSEGAPVQVPRSPR
jgi:2,3-bisphosphoglycerate-dependent phosphoglycerate mutase